MAYPGLTERLDAIDFGRYPVAGLLRPVYAMFVKDDGRMRVYLDQARAGRDEWLGATAWLMTAGMAENHGNFDEMRVSAIEAVDRFRALGERWGLSMALRTIGNIQVLDGDLDGAVAAFTEASRWHGCPCGGPRPHGGRRRNRASQDCDAQVRRLSNIAWPCIPVAMPRELQITRRSARPQRTGPKGLLQYKRRIRPPLL